MTEIDERDRRARARRWLLFAAAVWLSHPLVYAMLPDAFAPDPTMRKVFIRFGWAVPMVPVLLWAAHLSRDRGLRANILTRGIAISNLVFALVFSLVGLNAVYVLTMLVAVAMGRALQLLGKLGLDGRENHHSQFQPVQFRGILIFTLLLTCADVVTLLWTVASTSTGVAASYFVGGYYDEVWASVLPSRVGVAVVLTALMSINAWGLLRLRTWALFGGMLTNIAIVVLAWIGVLTMGDWTAIALATTAGIRMLLPLPILSAALGREGKFPSDATLNSR